MGDPKPCPLTPNEQYAFMSLWCLSAAPLFYSGDMGKLDAFTLNVLCNPEVIEIEVFQQVLEGAQFLNLLRGNFLQPGARTNRGLHHARDDEYRNLEPNGEGNRVAGARIHLDAALIQVQDDPGEKVSSRSSLITT
jgi:hypothetical protein